MTTRGRKRSLLGFGWDYFLVILPLLNAAGAGVSVARGQYGWATFFALATLYLGAIGIILIRAEVSA